MKIKTVIVAAAIGGAAIPCAFFVASRLGLYFFGSTLDLILWPSSILLMAEREVPESILSQRLMVSVLVNVIYYITVAAIVYAAIVIIRRLVRRGERIQPHH